LRLGALVDFAVVGADDVLGAEDGALEGADVGAEDKLGADDGDMEGAPVGGHDSSSLSPLPLPLPLPAHLELLGFNFLWNVKSSSPPAPLTFLVPPELDRIMYRSSGLLSVVSPLTMPTKSTATRIQIDEVLNLTMVVVVCIDVIIKELMVFLS
jgi:hypothetical protein